MKTQKAVIKDMGGKGIYVVDLDKYKLIRATNKSICLYTSLTTRTESISLDFKTQTAAEDAFNNITFI